MLLRIACPCGHVGLANAESLPRLLTCSACGSSRRVEGGQRIKNKVAFAEWLLGAPGSPRATVKQK
jgi:hypothetical protein